MSLIKRKKHPLIIFLTAIILFVGANTQVAHGFSEQIIQRGATGDDVVELQARLQYIGFYNGKIDGVFGWSTYWAVRNYQDKFGMDVDGLVGPQMKDRLEQTTDFRKDFVYKALRDGRKFTHYGGVNPFEIQKGEKGSDGKGKGQGSLGPAQAPGATPSPGQGGTATPGATPDQGGTASPGANPDQGAPGQGVAQSPEAAPAPRVQPEPQGEPVPAPEEPEAKDSEAIVEKAMNVPNGFSENDIQIMAQAVYGEARGEPYIGQVAVAAVIINRMNSPTFPNTASGVIFEPRAFTAVADGQIYNTPNETSRRAVLDAINGQDPSGGATYYFNPDTATSGWIWTRPQIKKIGKHIFCN